MNQVMLIGKLAMIGDNQFEIKINDTQTVPVSAEGNIMRSIQENIAIGSTIGVKGNIGVEDGIKINAEKITFLGKRGE